jgi:hypothetical protein
VPNSSGVDFVIYSFVPVLKLRDGSWKFCCFRIDLDSDFPIVIASSMVMLSVWVILVYPSGVL